MLRADVNRFLVRFAEKLEGKEVISSESSERIRKFLRVEETAAYWSLFMIVSSLLGAVTVIAGVALVFGEYWSDFPKVLRGILGIIPVIAGGYFYVKMFTKYGKSRVWIEVASFFLMLMTGVSLFLTAETFEMEWELDEIVFVWIVLSIPLFYIKRASGIAYLYLSLATSYMSMGAEVSFSVASPIDFGTHGIWFWVFILAFLPHYFAFLDRSRKVQELRFMFLTLVLSSTIFSVLLLTVDSNRILWVIVWNVGVYLFAHRYMSDHFWFWRRIMIWLPQLVIIGLLVLLSNRFVMMSAFELDSFFTMKHWNGGEWYYFVLLLVFMAGVYWNYFRFREHYETVNRLVVFAPILVVFLMVFYEFVDVWGLQSFIINAYLLFVAIAIMVDGSENNQFWRASAGLLLYAVLVLFRLIDVDFGFLGKGIMIMAFGGVFFLITLFMKEKVERIQRVKQRNKRLK